MEITIIGWYGTETIGDRAILAGLFKVMAEKYSSLKIRLGSLYTFYTERTIKEDFDFYKAISGNKLQSLTIFCSTDPKQLRDNIRQSELLIVGGGPLEDLQEMYMLEYAFVYAKHKHVITMLLGCGWGPLKSPEMVNVATHLITLSDRVIFRDSMSAKQCLCHCPQFHEKVSSSIDPAFFACHFFNTHINKKREENYIAVNFRDVKYEGYYKGQVFSEDKCVSIVNSIISQCDLPIYLIPMHTFYIGGDDRIWLNIVKETVNSSRVKVFHQPLSLYETMEMFYNAKLCVGMRFHSIVLQTMLNGNNYVIDYTEPRVGKISGMMSELQLYDFYKERYISLYSNAHLHINTINNQAFTYNPNKLATYLNMYVNNM